MDFGIGLWTLDLDFGVRLWTQTLDLDLDCDKNNNTPYFKKDDEERLSLKTFYTCLNSSEPCLFCCLKHHQMLLLLMIAVLLPQFNLCCLKLEYSSLLISCSLELTFNVQSMIIYRMVIVEGRCDQLTSSSLHTYIIIG